LVVLVLLVQVVLPVWASGIWRELPLLRHFDSGRKR
jgi:hypothetical protein